MKLKNTKEVLEYVIINLAIYICFFGGIYFSGVFAGVEWSSYWIDFSWNMFNIEELKQIIGL
ncbi:hypothetical protein HLI_11570 [Halobacillus litoralis]|uniref:Uncharacterized protein n=1 Tax=Halobacillus litoralis TaxID=45668 RepID=A0A410MDN4_9BACI|nr:hypothetical protein [Halobacillus litoralis]QAS52788.1 hypothetical protein HLI_11570 [Halobacillus litoralis]